MNRYRQYSFYAVLCPQHGLQQLTRDGYMAQLGRAYDRWRCPACNEVSDIIEPGDQASLYNARCKLKPGKEAPQ